MFYSLDTILIIYMLYIHGGRCACVLAVRDDELDV
jgi:hypothetical protein